MRIKELFTVPDGKRVTEKAFGRVLVSSICSILLCMACLAGTTWAWFAVSVENKGNVIQIGTADVKVTVDDDKISIENSNLPDDFDKKATLYVTLFFNGEARGYVILNDTNGYKTTLKCKVGESYKFSWVASWFPPEGMDIQELVKNEILLEEEAIESTETTAPATEETTIPTADATTAPTSIPTEATEPITEPEETTSPTETG